MSPKFMVSADHGMDKNIGHMLHLLVNLLFAYLRKSNGLDIQAEIISGSIEQGIRNRSVQGNQRGNIGAV
jgi:hypothetical protein